MKSLKLRLKRSLVRKESRLLANEYQVAHAPIFIIAPPRSGSTLLYQCMTTAFRTSYTSNFMQRFPYCPVLFARIVPRALAFNPRAGFDSRYGHVRGFSEPSDGYAIWSRWFPESPQFVEQGTLSSSTLREMRQTILGIQHFASAPFINKSQRNALRASVLHRALPESLFIRLKRSHPETILSLYRAHLAHEGGQWFSVRPREYERILQVESPIERAVLHAAYSEIDITAQLERCPGAEVMNVTYAELCNDTHALLQRLKARYESLGWRLKDRGTVPKSFPQSVSGNKNSSDLRSIEKYMEKHADLFAQI